MRRRFTSASALWTRRSERRSSGWSTTDAMVERMCAGDGAKGRSGCRVRTACSRSTDQRWFISICIDPAGVSTLKSGSIAPRQPPAEPRAEDGRDREPREQADEHDSGRVQGRRRRSRGCRRRARPGSSRARPAGSPGSGGPRRRPSCRRCSSRSAAAVEPRSVDERPRVRADLRELAGQPGERPGAEDLEAAQRREALERRGEPRREHRAPDPPPRRTRSGSTPAFVALVAARSSADEAGPSIARSSARWRSNPVAASSTAASEPNTSAAAARSRTSPDTPNASSPTPSRRRRERLVMPVRVAAPLTGGAARAGGAPSSTTSSTPAMPVSAASCHDCVTVPLSIRSCRSEMPWVTGSSVRGDLDRRLELGDPEHEAAEEHRGEQRQQRQLDGLPLGVGDDRDEQAEPERREEQQADHERDRRRRPEHRHARARRRAATWRSRRSTLPSSPNASTLPATTSVARIGDDRNRSIAPLARSRTIDSAMSVTAMCWSTRARAAGP